MTVIEKSLTTDASGDATETFNIQGYVDSILIDFSASADAGTDTTITGYNGSSSFTLYTKDNANTDVALRPRVSTQDNTGTDLTYDGTRKVSDMYLVDRLTVTFAQGGASKTNVVTFGIRREY